MTDYSRKWQSFIIVATGVFMSTLDSSMVNIALPYIMKDFNSTMATTEWVVVIYLLTITSTLLFWGHLGNKFGRSRFYSTGMIVFGLASWACASSTSLHTLILFRCVQAFGASMMMAIGPAIIKESFPPDQLGRALGLVGVAVSLGLMSGPSLGGIFIEFFSWRSLFYLTVPVGIIFSLFSLYMLPPNIPYARDEKIDWSGSTILSVSLCIFTYILTRVAERNVSISLTLAFVLLSIVLMYVFVKIERRAPQPILPLFLFHERFFSFGILSAVLSFITLFSVIMLTPFYLDRILNFPPAKIGLVMMIIPASIMIIAPMSGWLSDRVERRYVATFGLIAVTGSIIMMTMLNADSTWSDIGWRLALLGGGQAMFLSPNSAAVMSGTGMQRTGTAAALLATARNLGMLLGVALASMIFALVFGNLTGGLDMKDFTQSNTNEFLISLRSAFLMASLTGLGGVFFSFFRGIPNPAK